MNGRIALGFATALVAGSAVAQPAVPAPSAPSTLPPSPPIVTLFYGDAWPHLGLFGQPLALAAPSLHHGPDGCLPQHPAMGIDWWALAPYAPRYAPQTTPPHYWLGW
jgi:hypothetical protein